MFSGIIENQTSATQIKKDGNTLRVTLKAPKGWKIGLGESINVDGVCSTVEKLDTNSFSFYYMPETFKKTNLGFIKKDHTFNIERSLTLNSLIGGHLVSGHIDTTAKVSQIKNEQDSKVVKFEIKTTKYIIEKGSVSINGVSLTAFGVNKTSFFVSLIPFTLKNTNLGELNKGDLVNIEFDLIAKYLEKLK